MSSTNAQKLKYVAKLVKNCKKCPLYQNAANSVPGNGNPDAKIFFIGEAPGFYEDQQGLPFVGQSGKLLDKLLDTISLSRSEVFIGNTIKHRPPNNRDPKPLELNACLPYLKAQLKIIKPKLVVTLGRFALNFFLKDQSISQAHGQVFNINWSSLNLTLFPLYHPAAGLRNGSMLQDLRSDFLKIIRLL